MKIIKEGLEMFTPSHTDKFDQFEAFEGFYGTVLPPIYKSFVKAFNLGRGLMKSEVVFHEGFGVPVDIGRRIYRGNNADFIGLYDMFSISESIQAARNAYENLDELKTINAVPIGECVSNIMLMVGIGEVNRDQILLENPNRFANGDRILFVARDVLEFVSKLCLIEREHIGYGISGYDKLYKNWNEDFWRIKGD